MLLAENVKMIFAEMTFADRSTDEREDLVDKNTSSLMH
jgi:hypothetical protein